MSHVASRVSRRELSNNESFQTDDDQGGSNSYACFSCYEPLTTPLIKSYMLTYATRGRGLALIVQGFSCRTATRIGSPYSTSSRRLQSSDDLDMFKKAVRDHSGPVKLSQSTISRVNAPVQSTPNPPSQPAGFKRKFEMASAGQSTLSSLHSAVYFDENDFDDDDELDLESPDPFPTMSSTPSTQSSFKYPALKQSFGSSTSSQTKMPERTEVPAVPRIESDIKYPDLPPVPANEMPAPDNVPSSSIPLPWSSSPPSHMLPPPKRRTLPWLKNEGEEAKNEPVTPARSKPAYPWNKTMSAVKEEQKELRRQNKKRQQVEGKTRVHQPRQRVASLFLSDEQRGVLEAVVDKGKSIFFTGSAGTGKSVLMREIIKKLRDKYRREPDRVAVTASTGLAACNIEGVTLHSFAGIGLGKEAVPELVKKVRNCGSVDLEFS